MQFGCIILIVAIAALWGGGQGIYNSWVAGSAPKTVAYDALIRDSSLAGWYKVEGASWALADAVTVSGTLGVSDDLYIVAQPTVEGDGKARLLVHVTDEDLARETNRVFQLPEKEQIAEVQKSEKLFFTKHPIEGLLEYGIDSDSKQTDAVSKALGGDLVSDYKIIQLNGKPASAWFSIAVFLFGLVILTVSVFSFAGNSSEEKK